MASPIGYAIQVTRPYTYSNRSLVGAEAIHRAISSASCLIYSGPALLGRCLPMVLRQRDNKLSCVIRFRSFVLEGISRNLAWPQPRQRGGSFHRMTTRRGILSMTAAA